METLEVSSWEEVQELMENDYRDYVFSDDDVAEAYKMWQEGF